MSLCLFIASSAWVHHGLRREERRWGCTNWEMGKASYCSISAGCVKRQLYMLIYVVVDFSVAKFCINEDMMCFYYRKFPSPPFVFMQQRCDQQCGSLLADSDNCIHRRNKDTWQSPFHVFVKCYRQKCQRICWIGKENTKKRVILFPSIQFDEFCQT